MNTKKKMSNKSIRGVIWHDIERGFYADRFRYLIAVLMLAGVLIIFGAAWYSYGECARKLGIAALIMAVLIIAGLILQRKREYYEYKKEDE